MSFDRAEFTIADRTRSTRPTNAHGCMVIGDDAVIRVYRLQSGSVVIDVDGNGGHGDIELSEGAADLIAAALQNLEATS